MAKFIMLIGLPGSGKSTYANTLTSSIRVTKYVSSDNIREELYGDASIQGNPQTVFKHMHDRTKQYLSEGFDVVYDATNVTRKSRRGIINEVKPLVEFDGMEAHIIWAPYNECVNRDKQRSRSVGEAVIRKFLYRWQSPFYDEGFNKIKVIHNCNIGWNRIRYSDALLEGMKIPHDNPHHSLNIYEHCAAAECYVLNKWGVHHPILEACAYHDIGKPFTKCYKSDENGKIIPIAHYYQHDNVGGYLVYGFFDDKKEANAVITSWLVCNHMQMYFQSGYYKNLNVKYKEWLDMLHEADVAAH